MTFHEANKALEYLAKQYPTRLIILIPKRTPTKIVGYKVLLYEPDEVMVPVQSRPTVQPFNLLHTKGDLWEITVPGGRTAQKGIVSE